MINKIIAKLKDRAERKKVEKQIKKFNDEMEEISLQASRRIQEMGVQMRKRPTKNV